MRALALALVAPFTFAIACGPAVDPVDAQIFVDACREPQKEVNGEIIGGISDCALTVQAGGEGRVEITNPSLADLLIAPTLDASSTLLTLFSPTSTVSAGTSTTLVLLASDEAAGLVAPLAIDSNAANVQPGDVVVIAVSVVEPVE